MSYTSKYILQKYTVNRESFDIEYVIVNKANWLSGLLYSCGLMVHPKVGKEESAFNYLSSPPVGLPPKNPCKFDSTTGMSTQQTWPAWNPWDLWGCCVLVRRKGSDNSWQHLYYRHIAEWIKTTYNMDVSGVDEVQKSCERNLGQPGILSLSLPCFNSKTVINNECRSMPIEAPKNWNHFDWIAHLNKCKFPAYEHPVFNSIRMARPQCGGAFMYTWALGTDKTTYDGHIFYDGPLGEYHWIPCPGNLTVKGILIGPGCDLIKLNTLLAKDNPGWSVVLNPEFKF